MQEEEEEEEARLRPVSDDTLQHALNEGEHLADWGWGLFVFICFPYCGTEVITPCFERYSSVALAKPRFFAARSSGDLSHSTLPSAPIAI